MRAAGAEAGHLVDLFQAAQVARRLVQQAKQSFVVGLEFEVCPPRVRCLHKALTRDAMFHADTRMTTKFSKVPQNQICRISSPRDLPKTSMCSAYVRSHSEFKMHK
jgi:hypothetical protein